MKPSKMPETKEVWPINLQVYRRSKSFTRGERQALVELNQRFDKGLRAWPKKIYTALSQLLQPIYDVLKITQAAKAPRNSAIHLLIQEMYHRQKPYWAWTEDEWLEVLCPTERDFHSRHKWSGNCRQYAVAISYLLCGFSRINEIGTFFQSRLAIKVFGHEAVAEAVRRVQEELTNIGYGSRVRLGVPHALYSALLLNRSPRLEDLTKEVLETVLAQCKTVQIRRGIKTLSLSLARLGILTESLSHSLVVRKTPRHYQAEADVPAEWLRWCKKWIETASWAPSSRVSMYYHLLKTGRWLAISHPEITNPSQWTRDLAVEYVASYSYSFSTN